MVRSHRFSTRRHASAGLKWFLENDKVKGKAADALSGVRKKASVIGLPFIVIFLGIYVMPMAASLLYSMQDNRFSKSFVGIKNYLNIWQNRLFLHALSNTFIISLFCVIASMLTAVLICFCFECKGVKANSVLALLVLPMMLPSIAVTTIWKAVFQTSSFTGRQEGIFALTLLFLWKYSGTAIVLLYLGLRNIPEEIREAAQIDGAGAVRIYLQISIPIIKMHISLALVVLLMFALRLYKESYLLFGEYPDESLYMIQHYMSNHFIRMNSQNVSVASVSFIAISLTLYYLLSRVGSLRLNRKV